MTAVATERPALIKTFIEEDLHSDLAGLAREHHRSISAEVRVALREYVRRQTEESE